MNSSEEYFYVCEVCLRNFDEGESVPKVLRCGHTFCKSCLKKLSKTSKKCPKCSKTFSEKNPKCTSKFSNLAEEDFPVNYALLSIIREKNDKKGKDEILRQTRCLKEELINLSLRTKETQELITFGVTQAIELENEITSINITDAEQRLAELRNLYFQTETQTGGNKSGIITSSFSLKDFENCKQFLGKIYSETTNGKRVFSYALVNGKVLYGKVSHRDDLILIHSLTLSGIPEDGVVVSFQELKKCIAPNNPIKTFFVILYGQGQREQTVIFTIGNCFGGVYFLKLCSGESGASFKGCNYCKTNDHLKARMSNNKVIKLININIEHLRVDFSDYEFNQQESSEVKPGDLVVSLQNEFNILRINTTPTCHASTFGNSGVLFIPPSISATGQGHTTQTNPLVAIVDYPPNLYELICQSDPVSPTVLDCGIVIQH